MYLKAGRLSSLTTSMHLVGAVVITLAVGTSGAAQDLARVEQVIQSYVTANQFMGAVLIAHGGDVALSKAYGSANLEWDVPNTPSTKFRLGSITKQFTAASILLLEERGKLKLDDPVKTHWPDAPAAWDKITIFNLLTHTSGIPNFTGFPEYKTRQPLATPVASIVGWFRDKPLDFAPGERFQYSNSGYVLLGYLIERISGVDYGQFVRENIFTPLAMKDSGYDSNSDLISHRASGYSPGGQSLRNADFVHMTIPHAAGALYSTVEDLLRWERGLFDGKLLTPASVEKMTTPFKGEYALGVAVRNVPGHRVIEHNGGIEGFNTALAYYPDDKLTIAVLSNVNGPAADQLATKLAALAHGETVPLQAELKETEVDSKVLDGYLGNYQLAPNFVIAVTKDGNHLYAQATGQPKAEIFAESAREFFYKVVDAQITFETDAQGRATGLVLHQNGRNVPGKRVEGTVTAALRERKEAAVDPKLFDGYVGRYQLAPTFVMTITREGNKLFVQATGQPRFELFAESEKEYFLKAVDAQITFEPDPQGKATVLILHQNGLNQRAARIQ